MPDHTIFNERPESQDRALKVIEKLGYTIEIQTKMQHFVIKGCIFCFLYVKKGIQYTTTYRIPSVLQLHPDVTVILSAEK